MAGPISGIFLLRNGRCGFDGDKHLSSRCIHLGEILGSPGMQETNLFFPEQNYLIMIWNEYCAYDPLVCSSAPIVGGA